VASQFIIIRSQPRVALVQFLHEALEPVGVVLCGADARLDVVGEPLRRAMRASGASPFSYRAAQLIGGRDGMPSLGIRPGEATRRILAELSA